METDLLRYGVDLLDLYRGSLSCRRVCALVTHLPDDAAVWRVLNPRGAWTRADLLASVCERRITALWATVAGALGQEVTDVQLADPIEAFAASTASPACPHGSGRHWRTGTEVPARNRDVNA